MGWELIMSDDMLKDLFEEEINEGLIRTIDPQKVFDYIESGRTDVEGYPRLYEGGILGIRFQMETGKPRIRPSINGYVHLKREMNRFGYYPAQYRTISSMLKFRSVSGDEVEKNIESKIGDLVEVAFHPKFSTPIRKTELPKYLYHICDGSVIENIKKIGLSPRTKNKIESHPERVYFCLTQKCLETLIKHNRFNRFSTSDTVYILKIETASIKDVEFYTDPMADDAVYTHQNISPSNISIIKPIKKK
jgi:hypothetical protein